MSDPNLISLLAQDYRVFSASQLAYQICANTTAPDTLTAQSGIIVAANPDNYNQLIAEAGKYIFAFDFDIADYKVSDPAKSRVVSHPFLEFVYNVNNFSSYSTLIALAGGDAMSNLPLTDLRNGVPFSKFICDPAGGVIQAVQKIIADGNLLNFNLDALSYWCPHIYTSDYYIFNQNTLVLTAKKAVIYIIKYPATVPGANDRVFMYGTGINAIA